MKLAGRPRNIFEGAKPAYFQNHPRLPNLTPACVAPQEKELDYPLQLPRIITIVSLPLRFQDAFYSPNARFVFAVATASQGSSGHGCF